MMKHTVLPLLIERIGGAKVMKVRVLRTCAVCESNIDRGIGDLMTSLNPTVGLAAHAGQTDVRITAKAATDTEAEAMIAEMEAKLRERLGVAIYGVGKETVAGVVGRLLAERELKLGVLDTLTGGQLTQELAKAGFVECIALDLHRGSPLAEWQAVGLAGPPNLQNATGPDLAQTLTEAITPAQGLGLVLLGPIPQEDMALTYIGLRGPDDFQRVQVGRNFEDSGYARRWLVIQGLDWVRRAVLGQMESPVDWS
jgi:hypothetical protein